MENSVLKKEKRILEKDILREICEWLALKNYFFWRSNNVPVYGQSHDGKYRFRALPKYTPRGLPDIIIIHRGSFIALEVKRPDALQRPEQKEWGDKCIINGGYYYLVHSLEEVKRIPLLGVSWQEILKDKNPNL